jgi:general secretion pathway protein D
VPKNPMTIAAFGLWALTLAGSACPGQPTTGVELAETVELARLVDLSAQRLGLNIEYDAKLAGSATVRLNAKLSDAELWDLTNRLLAARGYTTVRMGDDGTLSVVALTSAASLARLESPEAATADAPAGGPGFLSVLVPLRGRRVEDAVTALKPLLSTPGGSVTGLPESGSVIVADLRPRLALALRTLEAIESDAAASVPEEITVSHLPASQLITLLKQMAAMREAAGSPRLRGELLASPDDRSVIVIAPPADLGRWQELIGRFDRAESVETISYSPRGFGVAELATSIQNLVGGEEAGLRVVADGLTGTLQVTATPAQHTQVEELLARLATAPEAARRPTRTFTLQNRDAEEVLGVVQSLVTAGLTQPGTSATDVGTAAAPRDASTTASPSPTAAAPDQLQLTADPATNAIIAIGEVQELDRLARLIEDLDVRRPQVLLEVLIVSLSESDSLDLGVEMEKLILGPGDTIAKLSSLFGLSSTGAASGGIADRSSGGSAIVLSPGDFSVVLKALQSINRGRSLSMPKVLVASNEQATINSVLETPYTTINASDTVATTSYGGSSNAGTEVSVTPQIAEGDHLRLEYQVSLSAFVGEAADPSVPPPRQQNSINSIATIPDGFTIAVGGIELLTEGEAETRIPLISDLPLLGEAFKNRSRSSSRSRFYVFIRPTILRDRSFEDLKYLSDLDAADTGVDDGWPVQEPRLIR